MPKHTSDTSRVPRWLRVLLPSLLILGWLTAAGIGGPYFGKVSEVSSNDQTSYLPTSSDATAVQELLGEFSDSESIPAIIVFSAEDDLSEDAIATLGRSLGEVGDVDGVDSGISPLIPSDDGLAAQAFVPIDTDAELGDTVDAVRAVLADDLPDGVTAYVRSEERRVGKEGRCRGSRVA